MIECEHGVFGRHYPEAEVVWGFWEDGKIGWGVDRGPVCPGGVLDVPSDN